MTSSSKTENKGGATDRPWSLAEIHEQGLYLNGGEIAIMSGSGDDARRVCQVDAEAKGKRGEQYRVKCEVRDANAALIVKAVNAHESLVKALEEIARVEGETDPAILWPWAQEIALSALSKLGEA